MPLVPLKAAAGAFSDPQHIEDDGFEWVAVETSHRLRPGMFVAQVVGKSMEPAIPDGAYCLFPPPSKARARARPSSSNSATPPTPRPASATPSNATRARSREGRRLAPENITLKPVNPDFEPIVPDRRDEGELQVVAELVEVLGDRRMMRGARPTSKYGRVPGRLRKGPRRGAGPAGAVPPIVSRAGAHDGPFVRGRPSSRAAAELEARIPGRRET